MVVILQLCCDMLALILCTWTILVSGAQRTGQFGWMNLPRNIRQVIVCSLQCKCFAQSCKSSIISSSSNFVLEIIAVPWRLLLQAWDPLAVLVSEGSGSVCVGALCCTVYTVHWSAAGLL